MLAIKNPVGKCFACSLAFAVLLAGCSPPGPRALLHGKGLMEGGHYAEAVQELKRATSLLTTNAQAWNYLGVAYHRTGDAPNAAQAYQQALKFDRDLMEAHFNLGCLWLEQNRFDNAKSELAAFTLRRPNVVGGWLKLGTAQLGSRELVAAEKSFREALRLSTQNPEALNGLGLIQMQRNLPRDAMQSFNAALQQQPDYAPALLNLAIVSQSQLNNRPLALQKYREYLALPLRPSNWEAVNAVADALDQELSVRVRSAPTIAATPSGSNAVPLRIAGTPVVRVNVPSKPEPTSNAVRTGPLVSPAPGSQVVKMAPEPEARVAQDTPAGTTRGSPPPPDLDEPPRTEKRTGFFQKINPLNLFRRGSNDNSKITTPAPANASSQIETQKTNSSAPGGDSDSNAGSPNIARYPYHSWPKPGTGDRLSAEKFFMQGLQEHRAGRLPQSIEAYRRATQTDPAYFEAYYNLALAAAAAGDLPQALSAGESALAIRPESVDARLNFAQALKQASYFFDAANELATVLLKNADNARAHLALGNLYAQQFHQPAKARAHYLKVLDSDPRNPQAAAIRDWLVANPR